MDFNREWTQFALDAEVDHFGTARIAKAHNALRVKVARLESQVKQVSENAERCDSEKPCIDTDGAPTEMAVLKRFWIEHHSNGK